MKRMYEIPVVVLALVSLPWSQPAEPEWYSLGPENTKVNCILADDTTMILAGTDSGVMVRVDKKWHRATFQMPVRALERVSNNRVAIAIGFGSKGGGIHLGVKIQNAPYYQFSTLCTMESPEALAVAGPAGDTLYVCDKDYTYKGHRLYRCVLPKAGDSAVITPEIIKFPFNAFGAKDPVCTSLEFIFARLFAGGYDRSQNPDYPGHLLYNTNDSMQIDGTMNVSAMTVCHTMGGPSLAVGTIDSGIHVGRITGASTPPVKTWTRFDGPDKQPVNAISMEVLPNDGIEMVAAVKSGVFIADNFSGQWTELGSLPASPLCLALYNTGWNNKGFSYLAGTDNGVYRYGPEPPVCIQTASAGAVAPSLQIVAGSGEFRLVLSPVKQGVAEISVSGVSGKLICKRVIRLCAGANSIVLPLKNQGRGIYVISVRGGDFTRVSLFAFNRRVP